jgi:hypothetical protein
MYTIEVLTGSWGVYCDGRFVAAFPTHEEAWLFVQGAEARRGE